MAATNLLPNGSFENGLIDWNVNYGVTIDTTTGQQTSGTASIVLGGTTGDSNGELTSNPFPTTPGTNYIVQFDYETLDGTAGNNQYVEVYAHDAFSNLSLLDREVPTPTTKFVTTSYAFTATGTGATIGIYGEDQEVVDNVIVSTGSFGAPGKYTGSVKETTGLPTQDISSMSTESVVARITPSGGLYLIEQPSGSTDTGAFINSSTIAYSGTTFAVSIVDKTHIKFTTSFSYPNDTPPDTYMQTFMLHKVGK